VAILQVTLGSEIGSGEFGSVFSGSIITHKGKQLPSAIKMLKPGKSCCTARAVVCRVG
jgi:hypothetical protein